MDGKVKEAKINKGVRQECILSPMLFKLYIEEAMKELKAETQKRGSNRRSNGYCLKICGRHSFLREK